MKISRSQLCIFSQAIVFIQSHLTTTCKYPPILEEKGTLISFDTYTDRYSECAGEKRDKIELKPCQKKKEALELFHFHVKTADPVESENTKEIESYKVTIEIEWNSPDDTHSQYAERVVDVKAKSEFKNTWYLSKTTWKISGTVRVVPTRFVFDEGMYRDIQIPAHFLSESEQNDRGIVQLMYGFDETSLLRTLSIPLSRIAFTGEDTNAIKIGPKLIKDLSIKFIRTERGSGAIYMIRYPAEDLTKK